MSNLLIRRPAYVPYRRHHHHHVDQKGKIEWTAYPRQCGYITPGVWKYVAISYSKSGEVTLYVTVTSESVWVVGL